MEVYGKYFYGNKISNYGIENHRVDYATLAKAFDAVLNNNIMEKTMDMGYYWDKLSGFIDNSEKIEDLEEQIDSIEEQIEDLMLEDADENREQIETLGEQKEELEEQLEELRNEEDYEPDIYQWYIVSDPGAELLQEVGEIVYYCEELDIYLWGVTHFGTGWDYVLTSIKIVDKDTEN